MRAAIYEAGAGKWRIVYDAPPGPDGRRRQKSVTVRGTKKDAQRKRTEILHQLQTGSYVDPARTTVREYLERWLQDHVAVNCGAKTHREYARSLRNHVVPHIGGTRLPDLKPVQLVAMYNALRTSGRRNGRGGLSEQSILHCHRILHTAFKHAVRWQLLIRNPADAVEGPHVVKQEMKVLDSAQLDRLLTAAEGRTCYAAILLAVSTGMRLGEICGLKWEDVDMDGGFLSVRRSLEYAGAGEVRFKSPKTARSVRRIDLPPGLIGELRKHKARQNEDRLLMGPAFENNDLVCCRPDGRPFRPDYVSRHFRELLAAAGMNHIRFHDLRHTHATWLLTSGVHPKVVQERLGHGTIGITLDTYSHVLPSMQEEAARKIDAILQVALDRKSR